MRALGAYIHVPFCSSRCGYCDFNTYTAPELKRDGTTVSVANYADYLVSEIELTRLGRSDEFRPVDTVFFGGGTPTLLPAHDIIRLLDAVRGVFGLSVDAEVTVEANPDSVDKAYLDVLREGGVTRMSFGHQSSALGVLQLLDRTHTPGRTWQVVNWANEVGFTHISVDLIYGSPIETEKDLQTTLDEVVSAHIDHVSAYSLIVEPGTRLAGQVSRGEVAKPSDDIAAQRYEIIDRALSERGFNWYEVSNWAKPGGECRHNIGYWHNHDWFGFGPGAHAHDSGQRDWNLKHPAAWASAVLQGMRPIAGSEHLTTEDIAREDVMLRLRLREGLPISRLSSEAQAQLPLLANEGLISVRELEHNCVVLTFRGRLLADGIVTRLWN